MNSVDIFLELYRTLEEDLKEYYAGRHLKYSSAIYEYMNEDGRKNYDVLDVCREIRNILSHHSSFEGEDPITPSDSLIEALRGIIHEVENPVTALKIATPAAKLLTASLDNRIVHLLLSMEKRGFSHVPVIEDGILIGVFSVGAAFEFVRARPGLVIDSSVTLSDMSDYLPVRMHRSEQYLFCTEKTTLSEIRGMFKSFGPKQKRVAAVFVMKDSDPRSALCGMITPWDVIKVQQ